MRPIRSWGGTRRASANACPPARSSAWATPRQRAWSRRSPSSLPPGASDGRAGRPALRRLPRPPPTGVAGGRGARGCARGRRPRHLATSALLQHQQGAAAGGARAAQRRAELVGGQHPGEHRAQRRRPRPGGEGRVTSAVPARDPFPGGDHRAHVRRARHRGPGGDERGGRGARRGGRRVGGRLPDRGHELPVQRRARAAADATRLAAGPARHRRGPGAADHGAGGHPGSRVLDRPPRRERLGPAHRPADRPRPARSTSWRTRSRARRATPALASSRAQRRPTGRCWSSGTSWPRWPWRCWRRCSGSWRCSCSPVATPSSGPATRSRTPSAVPSSRRCAAIRPAPWRRGVPCSRATARARPRVGRCGRPWPTWAWGSWSWAGPSPATASSAAAHHLLCVVSLADDARALAMGPQIASYAASIGISTLLVPRQSDATAALWAACSSQPTDEEVRPDLRVAPRRRTKRPAGADCPGDGARPPVTESAAAGA